MYVSSVLLVGGGSSPEGQAIDGDGTIARRHGQEWRQNRRIGGPPTGGRAGAERGVPQGVRIAAGTPPTLAVRCQFNQRNSSFATSTPLPLTKATIRLRYSVCVV